MFERLDVQRCGQILISDALRALREVNPDLETNAGVQSIIESMGGEEEAVDLTQLSDFIKALEGVNQKENSKKVSIKQWIHKAESEVPSTRSEVLSPNTESKIRVQSSKVPNLSFRTFLGLLEMRRPARWSLYVD